MDMSNLSLSQSIGDCRESESHSKSGSQGINSTLCDSVNEFFSPSHSITTASFLNSSMAFSSHKEEDQKNFDLVRKHMCADHLRNYCYSCKNCEVHLCSECMSNPSQVLFEITQHRGHRFFRYDEKKEEFRLFCDEISAKISFKKKNANQSILFFQNKMQKLEEEKEEKNNLLEGHLNSIKNTKYNFDNEEIWEETIKKSSSEIDKMNNFYSKCLKELIECPQVRLISDSGDKIEQELIAHTKIANEIQTPTLPTPHSPETLSKTFKIPTFTFLNIHKKEYISPAFKFLDSTLILKAYPGCFLPHECSHISLYIQRMQGLIPIEKYTIKFTLTGANSIHIRKEFGEGFGVGDSWGYDKFTRVANLFEYGFIKEDSLEVGVEIRVKEFGQLAGVIGEVLDGKIKEKKKNEEKIRMLRQKLEEKRSMESEQSLSENNEKTEAKITIVDEFDPESCADLSVSDQVLEPEPNKINLNSESIDEHSIPPEPSPSPFPSPSPSQQAQQPLPAQPSCLKSPQTFLHPASRLIRLTSTSNIQLIEKCRRKMHIRSNTHL